MFDRAPDGIFLVSPDDHTIIDGNQTLCEISGWSREELIGRPAVELPHRDDVAAHPSQGDKAMTGRTVINTAARLGGGRIRDPVPSRRRAGGRGDMRPSGRGP